MEPRRLSLAAVEDGASAPEPGGGGDGARCAGVTGAILLPETELEVLGGGELEVLGAGARGADAGDGILVLGMELEVLAGGRLRFLSLLLMKQLVNSPPVIFRWFYFASSFSLVLFRLLPIRLFASPLT